MGLLRRTLRGSAQEDAPFQRQQQLLKSSSPSLVQGISDLDIPRMCQMV